MKAIKVGLCDGCILLPTQIKEAKLMEELLGAQSEQSFGN
jgi:hypothetical protein